MGKVKLNRIPSCCRKCKMKQDGVNCNGCTIPNKSKTHFICEICKCITPYECEGGYPKVCANCIPIPLPDEQE